MKDSKLDTLLTLADEQGNFFFWQLVGALKVTNPEILEEVTRDNLSTFNPSALAGFDAIWSESPEPEDLYTDVEADADTLASAGWGTDEDYGSF